MVQTWSSQGWTGYRNAAALCQTCFNQGWTGYRNEAARGGTVDPRRRVTHFPKQQCIKLPCHVVDVVCVRVHVCMYACVLQAAIGIIWDVLFHMIAATPRRENTTQGQTGRQQIDVNRLVLKPLRVRGVTRAWLGS